MNSKLIDLAVLPGIALLIYVYNKDKVEKEPLGLLLLLILGGLLSCGTSYVLEIGMEIFAGRYFYSSEMVYAFFEAFLVAALVEESSKFFFLNIFSWKNKNFNCSFDGLIYAIFVSLGFAIGENVLYVMESGFSTGISRAFTAVPAHMAFSIVMGIFYAKAKLADIYGKKAQARFTKYLGYFLAIVVHGLYDFLLMAESDFLIFVWMGLMVALYIFAFVTINVSSKRDRYLY